MSRRLLVTCALPYANGHLHLGHLVGYIQGDIWVRAQRMAGHTAHFVCADDAHGTPIMLAAEKAGLSPEEFIRPVQASHERDFADFGVDFDHYHSTHSQENRLLAETVYARLRDGGHIARRSIQQLYDPVREMFLPDRYIKGECPNCGSADQYGDNCEVCGKAYAPTDLKNPRSVMSGAVPELRESEHHFFRLADFQTLLRDWFAGKLTGGKPVAHPGVKAKLDEWLEGGLKDWDISRDAPYFGFAIPDAPGKFFYVWLDAPIGYLASFRALCAGPDAASHGLAPESFDAFLARGAANFDATTELHHFIGKDIINFHGLFWPAMLHGAGLRVPSALHVNGYLTVNGAKMSKSRGTFIQARTYLDAGLNPEFLRYYFAAKSSGGVEDLDLNLEDFAARVKALLRRSGLEGGGPPATLQAGRLRLDADSLTLHVGDERSFRLTPLEVRLLQLLFANAGQVVPADRLLTHVWGQRGGGDRQLLKQLVHRLRQKIGDPTEEPRWLETVPSVGYRLRTPD